MSTYSEERLCDPILLPDMDDYDEISLDTLMDDVVDSAMDSPEDIAMSPEDPPYSPISCSDEDQQETIDEEVAEFH